MIINLNQHADPMLKGASEMWSAQFLLDDSELSESLEIKFSIFGGFESVSSSLFYALNHALSMTLWDFAHVAINHGKFYQIVCSR